MRKFAIVGAAVLALGVTACSQPATTPAADATANATVSTAAVTPTSTAVMEEVIARHVAGVKAPDLEMVMADYTDDAILVSVPGMVTPSGTMVGKENVRTFFEWLATPENLPGAQSMTTSNEIVGPDTLLFRWTVFPGTPQEMKGYDVFVFREGKIMFQTTSPNP